MAIVLNPSNRPGVSLLCPLVKHSGLLPPFLWDPGLWNFSRCNDSFFNEKTRGYFLFSISVWTIWISIVDHSLSSFPSEGIVDRKICIYSVCSSLSLTVDLHTFSVHCESFKRGGSSYSCKIYSLVTKEIVIEIEDYHLCLWPTFPPFISFNLFLFHSFKYGNFQIPCFWHSEVYLLAWLPAAHDLAVLLQL